MEEKIIGGVPQTAMKTLHRIITPACRANKGNGGALNEVEGLLAEEYLAMVEAWPESEIHIVMLLERNHGPTD